MIWRWIGGAVFVCLAVADLGAAPRAQADLWTGFYVPSRPAAQAQPGKTGQCLAAILSAQERFGIPDNLLLAIGIQEAGRQTETGVTVWPWAVNAEGEGVFFGSREKAIGWVREARKQGIQSIDVGCMQVNLFWHSNAFDSLESAFDPVTNANYAAKFLRDLKRQEGSWWAAAGSYHSKTPRLRDRYLESLRRNHAAAKADFPRLLAAARSAGPVPGGLQPGTRDQLPTPPVLWGADEAGQNRFSIYSRQPLTSVLPVFKEVF